MSKRRHLAAIMFTDIVGYTALMGKNEAKAMDNIHLSRTVQKRLVKEFSGSWLKEMGDGALCTFQSASDAVYCALEIQEHLRENDLELRIGIHLSEVLIENGDIFSEGVNVASRLQAIAEPGGIYLSESVQKAIRGQSDIKTVYLGEINLKNVDYPIKTYALRGEGLPPVINGSAKRLSGRIWAEIKRRNIHRAGVTYLCLSCLVLSITPYIALMDLFRFELLSILGLGFVVAMVLAWNYEKGPKGFIRISSRVSWENPLSDYQKKPLTSNLVIMSGLMVLVIINAFTLMDNPDGPPVPIQIDPSVAVMPLDNFSSFAEQHHYGDCIQEEILTQLAKHPRLDVKSRTSTLPFRRREDKSMKEIGKKLKAQHVLEGSVRRVGNKVRVTAQLIKVETDSHIWSDTFEREITTDSLDIQREIAAVIALEVTRRLVTRPVYLAMGYPFW